RRLHPHDAGFDVQLRHAFETSGRTLLDAHAAAFAVVDQDLVEPFRAHRSHDARLGADQVAVVARVAGAAAEAAIRFLDGLLLRVRVDYFVLGFSPAVRGEHRLLHARE